MYVPKTRSNNIAKTVQFFLHQCPVPKTSSVDAAIVAARALTEALINPAPAAPFSQFGNAYKKSIVDLSKIFEIAIEKPALPIIVPPQPTALTTPPVPLRVTTPPSTSESDNSPSTSEGDNYPSTSEGAFARPDQLRRAG